MPEVNRYTQMPQPLMLNPLSFEELSRVPLAKAQANAEGAAALNRIQTDYNVDERDLGQVTQWIDEIDQQKTNIVDNMFNQGVTTQVVNDVLKLKRNRDNLYKTKINQAEENKRRIEAWRQTVDQMYAKDSPEYAELVKQKEMQNWKGTFAYGDTPQTFVGSYGPKYFDLKKDVFEYMSQAKEMTELESKYRAAGAPREVTVGEYQGVYTPGEYSKQVLSNKYKLAAVADQLRKEYLDKNTERGRFKDYVEMTDQELDYEINQAYNAYLQEMTREQGGGGSYSGMTPKQQPIPEGPMWDYLDRTRKSLTIDPRLSDLSSGTIDYLSNVSEKASAKTATWSWGKFLTSLVPGGNIYNATSNVLESISEQKEADKGKKGVLGTYDILLNKWAKDGTITNLDLNNLRKNDLNTVNKVFGQVKDYIKDMSTGEIDMPVLTGDYLKSIFGQSLKNKPELTTEDIASYGHNYYTLEGDVLDKDESSELRVKMLNSKTKATGTLPIGSPALIDKKTHKFIKGLSSGTTFIDKDEKGEAKTYIVPLSGSLQETPEFKRIENLNEYLLDGTYLGRKKDIVYLGPDGKYRSGKIKHDETNPYHFVLETTKGVYEEIDPSMYAYIHSPEYYNSVVKKSVLPEDDYTLVKIK